MFTLHTLTPLVKKRKRVGRGGKRGGTSGKGHKGQKARSGGGVAVGFEGGQMPLYRRLPKRGFSNARFKQVVEIVNIELLERLRPDIVEVTREVLLQEGILKPGKKNVFAVKVLGNGSLSRALTVTVDAFSASAKEAIEKAGGKALTQEG